MSQGRKPLSIALRLLALLLLSATATAEELTAEACLTCHGVEAFAGPTGRALFVSSAAFGTSVHGVLPCTTCHADATEIPHDARLKSVGLDTCAACHEDAVNSYRSSVHGKASSNGVQEAATCTNCHGNVHAVISHTEATSPTHWSHLAATCARCHGDSKLVEKFHIPLVRPVEAYLQSVHARAIAAGKQGATCSDCHGSHAILPSTDPSSSIWRTNVPDTCGTCHKEILDAYRGSVHGEALAHGNRGVPVCTDCHGEHRILGTSEPTSPVFAANIPGETCGRCHANERVVEKYGLERGTVSAFNDSFHGLALRAGKLTVANCSSCHGVHDIRRSSDPRSQVHPANLNATCGKCHPGAGTGFSIGQVHSTAASTSTWAVSWVRFIYLWLIGLTISGMVVHNGLDLSRKARQPLPSPPLLPTDQPQRMSRSLRWQHGLVMLSFPILVYTGFALKYPGSWWAAPLLQWETGLGLRGLVHRIAALVMLSAIAWHLGHLVVSRRLRSCMRNLLPSWRDLRVAAGTAAYYAGRRSGRPPSGTFNYAEKAEYWAFMWGAVIMGLTGFLLWFENATLRYLPGWVAEVATAIHFYEAILATLSILVWHFYWVIFDPEVYPMDWTWWDGHPPASRVHERLEPAEDAGVP